MDFFTISNEVLQAYWWLIPIASIIGIFKSPWGKGYLGELFVRFFPG
jgi:restriction system protein